MILHGMTSKVPYKGKDSLRQGGLVRVQSLKAKHKGSKDPQIEEGRREPETDINIMI